MRICIWFNLTDGPWGGGNNFLRGLRHQLLEMGHEVHHDPNRASDLVLVNAFNRGPGQMLNANQVAQLRQTGKVRWWLSGLSSPTWRKMNRRGPTVVHRVDGVAEFVRGFRTKADDIQPAVNAEADLTIFQTVYCRDSFEEAGAPVGEYEVINNAVDPRFFFPNLDKTTPGDRPLRFFASSWSSNPRKGFETIAALSLIEGVEVSFAGRWAEDIDAQKVQLLGAHPSSELGEMMREQDALIHAAKNEPCSNTVVEALASGLPVLYLDSGGNHELAGDYGVSVTEDLVQDVDRFRGEYATLRERVLDHREKFLMPRAAKAYLESFERAEALR
jgi:glycosyltransferase involved in cell wall biosynthesis